MLCLHLVVLVRTSRMWPRDRAPYVWPLFLYFRFRSLPANGSDHVTYAACEWKSPLPFHGATVPSLPETPHCRGFTITLRPTTIGRTPLDERSVRRGDHYLTTHSTHTRQTSMPPGGIRTRDPKKRAAAYPRLRPHGPRIGSEIFTDGNYNLTLLLLLLTHRFSERNATRFPLQPNCFCAQRI